MPQPTQVIDPDERLQIKDTTIYPYRCICFLKISFADGYSAPGTGWLASSNTVITAGHCVFDPEHGGRAEKVEVIPGASGRIPAPYGVCFSSDFDWDKRWEEDGSNPDSLRRHDHDYGAIFLPGKFPFQKNLGCFGFWSLENSELLSKIVCICGYPSDKDEKTQWYHQSLLSKVEGTRLHYQIDTYRGQSGSPVWCVSEQKPYAIGIHNGGSLSVNYATRINDDVFKQIKDWIAQRS